MCFARLNQQDNNYFITHQRKFTDDNCINMAITIDQVQSVLEFCYQMTFGSKGEHRNHRTGGQHQRDLKSIFIDAFTGKIGEFAFFNHCLNRGFGVSKVDLSVHQLGIWDNGDFKVNCPNRDYHVAVKTTQDYGNLLLLESADWAVVDNRAVYLPNTSPTMYDALFFCRVKSDIKQQFLQNTNPTQTQIINLKHAIKPQAQIVGWISNQDLVNVINNNHLLPQNSLLNGKTKMDADNYYIQSGCLRVPRRY